MCFWFHVQPGDRSINVVEVVGPRRLALFDQQEWLEIPIEAHTGHSPTVGQLRKIDKLLESQRINWFVHVCSASEKSNETLAAAISYALHP
jgi:hypothetical protein